MRKTCVFGRLCGLVVLSAMMLTGVASAEFTGEYSDPYYKERPQFHFYPAHDMPRLTMDHIGPIGIGLELVQPAFTMHLVSVEPGSPAAATGKLKPGQIIESINGKVLKDIDPRIILGNLITEAEATDGILKMMVKADAKAEAEEVIVTIPVIGAYSDTWPLDCPKSDKIVRQFADFLATAKPGYGSALFLLSTGEEKDLDVVRKWFSGGKTVSGLPWDIGYNGPAVCEYYLRTGDESVLPGIKHGVDNLKERIYNGSWMGRGGCNYRYMGGGHMNAAGVHCLTFLLLAKECGVDVDEHTLQSCLYHFYRFAGHWNVAYGDGLPEEGGVDNGKNGGLAFAMAAAASLHPAGEKSVYAKARDINANKSFYTTSWLFHGHTGGGIGELWRGASAGLLAEKRPEMYQSFMKDRTWMYELARRHDGAFGWCSGLNVSYASTGHNGGRSWGNLIPLIYTVPRKQLRIYGAPRTKFSKPYTIPDRPWGTQADEAFYSLEPGEYAPGKRYDPSKETIATHASMELMQLLADPEVSDETLLMFAHHPDSIGRAVAGESINTFGRHHLIVQLLKSKDPRGRLTGVRAAAGKRKRNATPIELTDEMIELIGGMIADPEESWWVVMEAMSLIGLAPAEKIAPYYDSLAKWLKHEDWWIRQAAVRALTPLVAHDDYYAEILPAIGELIRSNSRAGGMLGISGIVTRLQSAKPEIQALALQEFAKAYSGYPTEFSAPGGQDMSSCVGYMLSGIARTVANTPGGYDALYAASRKRFPDEVLPHKGLYMGADASKFGPVVKEALKPILIDTLIPKYVGFGNYLGQNSDFLLQEAASTKFSPRPKMPELVALYKRIGVDDYDWHAFGPDRASIAWSYHTFDPPEEKIWEPGWRYREVTVPAGMENWTQPGFDTKQAGWKRGHAPFGQLDGKIPAEPLRPDCTSDFCRCSDPINTFWDKEVLLMQAKVKVPKLKEGHIYRICIAGMSHVNAGDGFEIYINGKLLVKRPYGVGKRAGGRPVGTFITKELWPDFDQDATIAVKGFCPIPGGRHTPGVRYQHFSLYFEEMKAPTITEEMILKGRAMQPMFTSAWQASRDNADKFTYDGEFAANQKLVGEWTAVAQVAAVADYKPGSDMPAPGRHALTRLDLKADGTTTDDYLQWSGDTLMDLNGFEARKMQLKQVDGKPTLFVESGGFNSRHPADWQSPWVVMKRR